MSKYIYTHYDKSGCYIGSTNKNFPISINNRKSKYIRKILNTSEPLMFIRPNGKDY